MAKPISSVAIAGLLPEGFFHQDKALFWCAFLSVEIDMDQPEAFLIAKRPFVIVQKRPVEISPNIDALADDLAHGLQMLADMRTGEGASVYSGQVKFTELLGEVTQLYFRPQGGRNPVIAKLPGIVRDLRGQTVTLTANPAKVHLFADGKSLLYR